MTRTSLRTQLLAIGLLAALAPLVVLVLVVFGVEEDVSVDVDRGDSVAVVSETGVSSWIPAAAVGLGLVAAVGVRWWAKRAVDPIERMTTLTDEIQGGSLDRRLALDDAPDEIRRLGDSFDRMLDRLADASAQERRLIEDASHELRTPLAALSARIEVAGRRAAAPLVAADLAACEADVQRLQNTLETLLSTARSRQGEVEQVDNDITAIVTRVVERQRLVAPAAAIALDAPPSVRLGVDGPSIERAVANLVSNAVTHGAGAPVRVTVHADERSVEIVVSDGGPGIAADRLPLVFDRYEGEGPGLGLALVKQVADAYGSVDIESPVEGRAGTRVTLRLDR